MFGLSARLGRRRQTLRSLTAIMGGGTIAAALGALGGVIAARYLGPEVQGRFRYYTIPLMYLSFLHLGTFDGLGRQIPIHMGQDREDLVCRIAAAGGAWNRLLSGVAVLGFGALAVRRLALGDAWGAAGWATQAVASIWIFYGGYLGATYRTASHFVALARIQTFQAILSFLLSLILPMTQFFGLCLRSALPSALGSWVAHRARPLRIPLVFDKEALWSLVRVGLPYCIWGSVYTSLWGAVESTLMLRLGGVRALGLFTVAMIIREGLSIVPQAVNQLLTPRMVEAYGRTGNASPAARSALRTVVPLVLATSVLAILTALALDWLVPRIVPRYLDGLPLMKASLIFPVVNAAALPLSTLFAVGGSWRIGRGVLVGALAFPAATFFMAPHLGGELAVVFGSLAGRVVRTAAGYVELMELRKGAVD